MQLSSLLVCVLFCLAPQRGVAAELPVIRDPSETPPLIPINEADAGGYMTNDPYTTIVLLNDILFAPNILKEKDDASAEHWIVYFCPTWWEPCRNLLKPYALQSAEWQGNLNDGLLHSQVRFARVDCASHKPLCNSQGVNTYPMLMHYFRGQVVSQWSANGRNDDKRLGKWITAQVGNLPSASTILGKAVDARLLLSKFVVSSLPKDRILDVLVLAALIGLNFWTVCRNPGTLKKENLRAAATASSIVAGPNACDAQRSTVCSSSVVSMLPEDWRAISNYAHNPAGLEL